MVKQAALPVYEVEFLPVERRVFERCGPLQRLKEFLASGERRTSPGRRQDDWNAFRAAGLTLAQ
jgi:hypothetical protein